METQELTSSLPTWRGQLRPTLLPGPRVEPSPLLSPGRMGRRVMTEGRRIAIIGRLCGFGTVTSPL